MNKFGKKFLTLALAATLALSSAGAITAEAAPSAPESVTYYQTSKNGSGLTNTSLGIQNLSKSDKISKSSVKSSKTSVAEVKYLEKYKYSNTYTYQYYNGSKDSTSSYNDFAYYIGLTLKKPGTSTIKYKINDKQYSTKITVKKYENPLKTISLTGVNSGKNCASKYKEQNNTNVKLNKNVKNAQFKLAAKSGWKITSVYCYKYKKNGTYSNNYESQYLYNYDSGRSSLIFNLGNLSKDERYSFYINMTNSKTNGTLVCNYYVNSN